MLWHEAYDKAYLDINVEIHKCRPGFYRKYLEASKMAKTLLPLVYGTRTDLYRH